jgi:16S rRNA (adenine1518-N6/adenine1519-N6)-dimethyltransferase
MMVVMVQKEVAETIAAPPGRMSLLSVSVQFYGEPAIVGYVPAASFYPAPEVDSAVLKIDVYPKPRVAVDDEEAFFRIVRAGFSAPRKQLVNSLAQGLAMARTEVLPFLEKAGVEPQHRAETLSLEEWARLYQHLPKQEE